MNKKNTFMLACCLLVGLSLSAQSPYLDQTFGVKGRFSIFFNPADSVEFNTIYTTAIQADGKIVCGGMTSDDDPFWLTYHAAITRITPDGQLDLSFGNQGRVVIKTDYFRSAAQVLIQPDGKILVAGWGWSRFMVARLLPNGALDSDFGIDGIAYLNVITAASSATVLSMSLFPNGNILVTGAADMGSYNLMMAQLKPNGNPDTKFGNFGIMKFNANGILSMVEADGNILAVFRISNAEGILIQRFNALGDIDTTFSEIKYAPFYGVNRLFKLPDGKLVVAGSGSNSAPIAVRFNADGSLDTTYGFNGLGTIEYEHKIPPYAVLLQPDGKLLFFGSGTGYGVITRMDADGTLDTDFGLDGFILPETIFEIFYNGCLLPDGKFLVPSRYENALGHAMGSILRYMSSSSVGLIQAPTSLNDLSLYPNPVSGAAMTLKYEIPIGSRVRIDLLDLQGSKVSNLLDAARPAGENEERLILPAQLSPGTYLLNIQTDKGNSVVRFTAVR